MGRLFLAVFNRGMAAGYLILAVIAARLLLKKAPKNIICMLWMAVGLRLACPLDIQTAFGLLPKKADVLARSGDLASNGVAALPLPISKAPVASHAQGTGATRAALGSGGHLAQIMDVMGWIWLMGLFLMCAYLASSWYRIRKSVATAVPAESDGIRFYQCDGIPSPFLFGLAAPRIYVPFSMAGQELSYVLRHEKAHQSRFDYLTKFVGYLLLAAYWFHPLVWAAYLLLCRDIELACDEKVVKELGEGCKKAYSEALLACSVSRGAATACPVAFGEIGVKDRVKNILNYKKPKFLAALAAAAVCLAVVACFATEAKDTGTPGVGGKEAKAGARGQIPLEELPESYSLEQAKADNCVVFEDGDISSGQQAWDAFVSSTSAGEPASVRTGSYYTLGDPSGYSPEYYESIKDEYPALYMKDLVFDGSRYTLTSYEDGKKWEKSYAYLKKFEGEAKTPHAIYDSYVYYVLTDKADATWEQLLRSSLSSLLQDYIDYSVVYTDHHYPTDGEDLAAVMEHVEQWAEAFCGRDAEAVIGMVDGATRLELIGQDTLQGEHSFGWSSPWPWNAGDFGGQPDYRILSAGQGTAVILYYAWTSDPHVTVWNQVVTYQNGDGKEGAFLIDSVSTEYLDDISTAGQFYAAYPDGVIDGTRMDYVHGNDAGETLSIWAPLDSSGLFYSPDRAARYLLNIQTDPSKVKTDVSDRDGETIVTFTFAEDGQSVSVKMVQPYGEYGIWLPQTDTGAAKELSAKDVS